MVDPANDPAPGELAGEQGKLASCGQARVFLTTMSKKSPVRRGSWTECDGSQSVCELTEVCQQRDEKLESCFETPRSFFLGADGRLEGWMAGWLDGPSWVRNKTVKSANHTTIVFRGDASAAVGRRRRPLGAQLLLRSTDATASERPVLAAHHQGAFHMRLHRRGRAIQQSHDCGGAQCQLGDLARLFLHIVSFTHG